MLGLKHIFIISPATVFLKSMNLDDRAFTLIQKNDVEFLLFSFKTLCVSLALLTDFKPYPSFCPQPFRRTNWLQSLMIPIMYWKFKLGTGNLCLAASLKPKNKSDTTARHPHKPVSFPCSSCHFRTHELPTFHRKLHYISHKPLHTLLVLVMASWISDSEQNLEYRGSIPFL